MAHVREKTSELDADDLFTIRSAIPAADRGTASALSRLELGTFIERLQDDIQTGVDRLLEEGMISTFSAAQSVEIMFPAQPEQSPTLSKVIFLDTENQVDNRDDLLIRLNEPGRSIPPTSGDQYDCSVLMSYLHGTGGSELRSYRDVLARIRPRFDPLLNEQDAVNLPTDEELTTVYNQLSRLSHQMVCVSMVRHRI